MMASASAGLSRRRSVEQLAQRATAHVLHHQVRQALVAALVVDGDDVRVGQSGDRLRLVGEPVDEARIVA